MFCARQFQHEIRACAALLKPQKAAALRAKTCAYRAGNRLCPAMRAIRNNISFPPHFAESASAPRIQGSKPGVVQTKRKYAGNRAFPSAPASKRWLCAQPRGDGLRRPSGPPRRSREVQIMFVPSVPPEQDRRDGLCRPSDSCAASRWLGLCLCSLVCRSNPAEEACTAPPAPAPFRDGPVYVCVLPEQPRGDGLRRPSGPCVASKITRVYFCASCPAGATPRK